MTEATPGIGRFLTLADTAEQLNISVRQAAALVHSGELPAIRVGNRWRIERSVLESYIEAMYEQTRRMCQWNQGEYANVTPLPLLEARPQRSPL
jgi:excisionase family DNA binding protein